MPDTFDLMRLPTELRLHAYDFVVPEYIELHVPSWEGIMPYPDVTLPAPYLDGLEREWSTIFPCLPITGQVLRVRARGESRVRKLPPSRGIPDLVPLLRTSKKVYGEVSLLAFSRLVITGSSVADLVQFAEQDKRHCNIVRQVKSVWVNIPCIWDASDNRSCAREASRWLKLQVTKYTALQDLRCAFYPPGGYRRASQQTHFSYAELLFFRGVLRNSTQLCKAICQRMFERNYIVRFQFVSGGIPLRTGHYKQYRSKTSAEYREIVFDERIDVDGLLRQREIERLKDLTPGKENMMDYFNNLGDGMYPERSPDGEARGRAQLKQCPLQSKKCLLCFPIRSRSV